MSFLAGLASEGCCNKLLQTCLLSWLTVRRPEVQTQGVDRAMFPLEPLGKNSFLCRLSSWWLLAILGSRACGHAQLLCWVWRLAAPWTGALQAPLSMRFPRQEYWCGLPFPPSGDRSDPGIKPASPALAGGFFATELSGKLAWVYTTPISASSFAWPLPWCLYICIQISSLSL